jgi:hypothetical protein
LRFSFDHPHQLKNVVKGRQKAGFFERDDSEAVQTATDCQEEAPVKNRPAWFQEEQSE